MGAKLAPNANLAANNAAALGGLQDVFVGGREGFNAVLAKVAVQFRKPFGIGRLHGKCHTAGGPGWCALVAHIFFISSFLLLFWLPRLLMFWLPRLLMKRHVTAPGAALAVVFVNTRIMVGGKGCRITVVANPSVGGWCHHGEVR